MSGCAASAKWYSQARRSTLRRYRGGHRLCGFLRLELRFTIERAHLDVILGVIFLPSQSLRRNVLGVRPPSALARFVFELDNGYPRAVVGEEALMRNVTGHRRGERGHAIDQGHVIVFDSRLQAGAKHRHNHDIAPRCESSDSTGLSTTIARFVSADGLCRAALRFSADRRGSPPKAGPNGPKSVALDSNDRADAGCRRAACTTPWVCRPASSNKSVSRISGKRLGRGGC